MVFSKREYLLRFRNTYNGAHQYKAGDHLWTRIYPKVINGTEYYMCRFEPWTSEYRAPAAECWEHFDEVYSGEFLVPCDYVEFDEDLEAQLRDERARTVQQLKTKWADGG